MNDTAPTAAGKKILIAEDETDLREALVAALRDVGGFTTITAADGKEALELALAEQPDLLFLDLRMPELDGAQVLQQVRSAGEWGENVPISILTAQSDLQVLSKALEIGGPHTNYLTKTDWTLEKLIAHAKSTLGIQ